MLKLVYSHNINNYVCLFTQQDTKYRNTLFKYMTKDTSCLANFTTHFGATLKHLTTQNNLC